MRSVGERLLTDNTVKANMCDQSLLLTLTECLGTSVSFYKVSPKVDQNDTFCSVSHDPIHACMVKFKHLFLPVQ